MAEIKNQRMSEWFSTKVEGLVAGQVVIQLFVKIKGLMKIVQYLLSFFLFTSFIENYRTTVFSYSSYYYLVVHLSVHLIGKQLEQ